MAIYIKTILLILSFESQSRRVIEFIFENILDFESAHRKYSGNMDRPFFMFMKVNES